MSVQPPAGPHRIAVVDLDIPFWRIVMILVKWSFAAIPAAIIIGLIYMIVFGGIALVFDKAGMFDSIKQLLNKGVGI